MRDENKEAMRIFFAGKCYTAENLKNDYLFELTRYSNARWEAPQRAARLSAAVKRFKTSEMLCFIFANVARDDTDLTPITVKRLCKTLFNRNGSQSLIVEVFGEKCRQHRSKDSNLESVEKIAEKYRDSANRHWSAVLDEIEEVKGIYQAEIKKSKGEG